MKIDLLIDNETDYTAPDGLFLRATERTLARFDLDGMERAEVSIVLVNDTEIAEMNTTYRGKEGATDVLSFPMSEDGSFEDGVLGDIVISIETARKQAAEAEIGLTRELAFLYIHGLLHLMGYDHERGPEEEAEMFDMQESILKEMVDAGEAE